MDELIVKSYTERWLRQQANVNEVLSDQPLVAGGLQTDFITKGNRGEIVYVVECKGSVDIGELTKGIGQAYEYEYQKKSNPSATKAKVLLVCPEDVTPLLDLLEVPDNITVYLVSASGTLFVRTRHRASKSAKMEKQIPGTFYIRDVELNHLKKIIRLVHEMGRKTPKGLSTTGITSEIGKRFPQIAAGGFNHLITLRSMGLLDDRNLLTPRGHEVYNLIETSSEAFLSEMTECFYPFIANVLNAIIVIAYENKYPLDGIKCSAKDVAEKICEIWGEKIRYLYDARTVDAVLRILEELKVIRRDGSKMQLKKLVHATYLP